MLEVPPRGLCPIQVKTKLIKHTEEEMTERQSDLTVAVERI